MNMYGGKKCWPSKAVIYCTTILRMYIYYAHSLLRKTCSVKASKARSAMRKFMCDSQRAIVSVPTKKSTSIGTSIGATYPSCPLLPVKIVPPTSFKYYCIFFCAHLLWRKKMLVIQNRYLLYNYITYEYLLCTQPVMENMFGQRPQGLDLLCANSCDSQRGHRQCPKKKLTSIGAFIGAKCPSYPLLPVKTKPHTNLKYSCVFLCAHYNSIMIHFTQIWHHIYCRLKLEKS